MLRSMICIPLWLLQCFSVSCIDDCRSIDFPSAMSTSHSIQQYTANSDSSVNLSNNIYLIAERFTLHVCETIILIGFVRVTCCILETVWTVCFISMKLLSGSTK